MADSNFIPPNHQRELDTFQQQLTGVLGDNLFSLVLYGSAVRGRFDPRRSDLNVLIVLAHSTVDAQTVIAEAVDSANVKIEPFVITAEGMERSFRAFSVKFANIQRHYRLLAGEDPLAGLVIDKALCAFLFEQTLRNLRLRSVQAFIRWRKDPQRFGEHLQHTIAQTIIDLSEVLRLRDIELPDDFSARLPILSQDYGRDYSTLAKLPNFNESADIPRTAAI
jgi:predicted nucleotidyltransferase